jgi:DNA-binding SARP family transcriptional activator
LRASQPDRTIDRFTTQKTAALLALLALYPYRRHTREEVAEILWPDADLPAARDRLSQAVFCLSMPGMEKYSAARFCCLRPGR